MLVTESSFFIPSLLRRVMPCFILLAAATFASAAWAADGPRRQRQVQSSQSASWSPARINADAAAVPERAPRLVSRSTQQRQAVSHPASRSTQGPRQSDVRQVGFLEDYGAHGGVCDCGDCAGPYLADPACGLEGGYLVEPGCGIEPGFGMDPGCGVESFGGEMCGCDSCYTGIGTCDGYPCDPTYTVDCFPLFLPILHVDWNRFEFFIGSQSYHNPMNDPATGAATRADSGSFGFHQGFNEGRNLRPWIGADLAAQLGLRATQSNLHGEDFTDQKRNQIFITGGFFRRVDFGLQYGMVLDYLNDDWYYHADLLQLRGELSWKWSTSHGAGFHWMGGVNDETVTTTVRNEAGALFSGTETLQASTQYRAFYRYSFGASGQWTSYIGGTDDEHFLIGSDMDIPLRNGLSMRVGSTYFSPGSDSVIEKHRAEGWNLGISMVFRPGVARRSSRYCRPLFDVADNGSFFVF